MVVLSVSPPLAPLLESSASPFGENESEMPRPFRADHMANALVPRALKNLTASTGMPCEARGVLNEGIEP